MMTSTFLEPLFGGALIGLSATLLLLLNGRVAGISGILNAAIKPSEKDRGWRLAFIAGLLFGGLFWLIVNPTTLNNSTNRNMGTIALAGVLVGFGTVMGGGCTSGHGVCGISRLSIRSVLATVIFILFGVIAVLTFNHFFATSGA